MKKLMFAAVTLITLTSSMAYATIPTCSTGTPRNNVCDINGTNYRSCGNGTFIKAYNPVSACDGESVVYDPNGNPIRKKATPIKQERTTAN